LPAGLTATTDSIIPVTTFAIEIGPGYRPDAGELAGAGLTIAALVANNLLVRRGPVANAGAEAEPVIALDVEVDADAWRRAGAGQPRSYPSPARP
jgi:hypothetical protein